MIEQQYKVLGLMSGTSLDGLDIALVHFRGNEFRLLRTATRPYASTWLNRLRFNPHLSAEALLQLNHDYGNYLAAEVLAFCREQEIDKAEVDFIASHGHTWFHQPEKGFTYQLGCGPELTKKTGLKTITDFRTHDVALGGQGAPLVPIGDRDLFPQYKACLNLGGFANISFEQNARRLAFDLCPVNFVLNPLANKLGQPFDENGHLARSGQMNQELFSALSQLPYFKKAPPKSLGAEWVKSEFWPLVENSPASTTDKLATLSHFAWDCFLTMLRRRARVFPL